MALGCWASSCVMAHHPSEANVTWIFVSLLLHGKCLHSLQHHALAPLLKLP